MNQNGNETLDQDSANNIFERVDSAYFAFLGQEAQGAGQGLQFLEELKRRDPEIANLLSLRLFEDAINPPDIRIVS